MELLSPAGSRDSLMAAFACGADAVYLGYTAFGARSYAGNFDREGLEEAVQYAHERGKKIYVTVNTLVKQQELPELYEVLDFLAKANVDAVLVQDLGVAKIIMERYPSLTLHASTQMTVNNAQGAAFLKKLGFSRVVPARECSLQELKKIAETGVEVEAFAHGALCVSVSGQCLLSSMLGGRSGNRGKCAQPCRMQYEMDSGEKGYLLSTKDLMLLKSVPELMEAGICSLKIEGRMKRPEYVAAVTMAYREAIDSALQHKPYTPSKETLEGLRQVFNRGGFTEGYVKGQNHAALMSWQRPNHWGLPVGKVVSVKGNLAAVEAEREIHNGDGLQFRAEKDYDFTYSGNGGKCGEKVTVRIPEGCRVRTGAAVFRMTDAKQMEQLKEHLSGEWKRIPLSGKLTAVPGAPAEFTLWDGEGHSASAIGNEIVQTAQQRALSLEEAGKNLGRMKDTPYELSGLQLEGQNSFVRVSELNELRRNALSALREQRLADSRPVNRYVLPQESEPKEEKRILIASGANPEDADALLKAGADVFVWRTDTLVRSEMEQQLQSAGAVALALELPAVTYTGKLNEIHDFVSRHTDRIRAVVLNNIGQLGMEWSCEVWGGQGLNLMNAECVKFFSSFGMKRMTVSCELNASELNKLREMTGNSLILNLYGRTQLMTLSHCPIRTMRGDTRTDGLCAACSSRNGKTETFTDRKGFRFPLQRIHSDEGCMLRLYNAVTTDMGRRPELIARLQYDYSLFFYDETAEERIKLVKSYRSLMESGKLLHEPGADTTNGHLARGVE